MINKNDFRDHIYCPECNSVISIQEILTERNISLKYFFCNLCGKRVDLDDYGILRGVKSNLYKKRNQDEKINIAIDILTKELNFPHIFDKTLHHLLARTCYIIFKDLEREERIPIKQMTLTPEIINFVEKGLKPILNQKPISSMLKYLNQLSYDDFLKYLREYQHKLQRRKKYREAFSIYQKWVIEIVFHIMNQINSEKGLHNYEITIREDLFLFLGKDKEKKENLVVFKSKSRRNSKDKKNLTSNNLILMNKLNFKKFKYPNSVGQTYIQIWEDFLYKTHINQFVNRLVKNYNRSGNWIKNLRPTKKFQIFLCKVKTNLIETSNLSKNEGSERNLNILNSFLDDIKELRKHDILKNIIKSIILANPKEYNAYDIGDWLLISPNSVRNQLNKMFSQEEYDKLVRTQSYVEIDTIIKICKERGGKCHSEKIKNAKSRIHLECKEGHTFTTTYQSIVYQNTWCPHCHIYTSEEICRKFFEKVFKKNFPISYPEWLINENGNQMELDGFNEELNLAFEYQGIQHRKKSFGMNNLDLKKIKEEDSLKRILCEENGVLLIQVPDDEIVPYDEIQRFIVDEYEKRAGISLKSLPKFNYQNFNIYENKYAKKFKKLVQSKGGKLITPYYSAKNKVKIECQEGHQWETTPESIHQNNWCPYCAGNAKNHKTFFKKIGQLYDCKLVSDYKNAKTPLWYICTKGHRFKKDPYWLKKDYKKIETLCPICKKENYGKRFSQIVLKKGGEILTKYKGRFKEVTIRCENNHIWKTNPAVIYQGSWCPECDNFGKKEKYVQDFKKVLNQINYTLLSPYINNSTSVKLKCVNNHNFSLTPKYLKTLVKKNIEPCLKCRKSKS